jgi:hypothetical protein
MGQQRKSREVSYGSNACCDLRATAFRAGSDNLSYVAPRGRRRRRLSPSGAVATLGDSRGAMDHPHQLATTILDLFYEAHKFIGIGAILTDGTAGKIESVRLDDDHGFRISIRGQPGSHPVSKLKKFERRRIG